MTVRLPHNWQPRPYQVPLWQYLSRGGRRAVARWHRRSGKDDVFLHHTATSAHERIGNYWYLLPEYAQARKSMWEAVNPHSGKRRIDEAFPHEIRAATRENEMMIPLKCGSTFQLVGSDNFDSLVGSPPVGLVFSEYALSRPSAWGYLRPILLENGGWAGFNSTPRGNNHFKAMCKLAEEEQRDGNDWFYSLLPADRTGVFTEMQLAAELREMQAEHGDEFGKALWLQEYFCSFDAAILGSIYGDAMAKAELENRIGRVQHDPESEVHTAWDLGYDDPTAIWFFQMFAGEVHIIDYFVKNMADIPFYGAVLRGDRMPSDSPDVMALKTRTQTYRYGTHYVPHDARPRTLAAGGKSILQQLQAEKIGRCVIAPRLDVQEGIQAGRATLQKCWFDADNCEDGIEAMKNYRRVWDPELKTFSHNAVHDWASHGADAFRVLSLVWKSPKLRPAETPIEERMMKVSIQQQTWGEVRKKHFARKRRERNNESIH